MIVIVWHLLAENVEYDELGEDYFTEYVDDDHLDPEVARADPYNYRPLMW